MEVQQILQLLTHFSFSLLQAFKSSPFDCYQTLSHFGQAPDGNIRLGAGIVSHQFQQLAGCVLGWGEQSWAFTGYYFSLLQKMLFITFNFFPGQVSSIYLKAAEKIANENKIGGYSAYRECRYHSEHTTKSSIFKRVGVCYIYNIWIN